MHTSDRNKQQYRLESKYQCRSHAVAMEIMMWVCEAHDMWQK